MRSRLRGIDPPGSRRLKSAANPSCEFVKRGFPDAARSHCASRIDLTGDSPAGWVPCCKGGPIRSCSWTERLPCPYRPFCTKGSPPPKLRCAWLPADSSRRAWPRKRHAGLRPWCMAVLGTKIEVQAQLLADEWAQFAANRCGIERFFVLGLQIFGSDKHLISCG
jgi:hypothetical protein